MFINRDLYKKNPLSQNQTTDNNMSNFSVYCITTLIALHQKKLVLKHSTRMTFHEQTIT